MSADAGNTLVADRYRVGRVIGVGGMGVVYEAEQLPLRRTVALKMLPRDRVGSEEAVQRLIREAQALSRIEHPGVVRVIDAGRSSQGQAFLAMEYLEGCTLKQLLTQHGPLPWRWVVAAMGQCLDALDVVHRAGFVHRDIKPSNCFCCSGGLNEREPIGPHVPVVKLIDFGIAKVERSRRPVDMLSADAGAGEPGVGGPLLGTPAYWAPEQVLTGHTSRRSDLYSMGATLYELLTGALPRRSDGLSIEPPSAVNPAVGIPPDLDAVVLKALSHDSEQRYESAAALHAALDGIEGDRSQGTATWPGNERLHGLRASLPHVASFTVTPSGEGVQLQRLRAKVQQFWIEGVLDASLATSVPGPPRTLDPAWVAGLGEQLEAPPPVALPETRSTAEVFEQHGQSLLIVGGAGSGKTTQLLLVARQLMDSGKDEVPVVLTLSTYRDDRQDLEDWLASELRSKYQVPTTLSVTWLRRGLILPLLDGFDEVPGRYRAGAIRAVNRALARGRLPGLVVTSRTKEYLDAGERLGLAIAVHLHPLSAATVDDVRQRLAPLANLTTVQWGELRPLLDTPLALSLLSLALGSGPLRPGDTAHGATHIDDLLDVYIDRMIQRSGKLRLPCEPAEFYAFLAQLSHEMSQNDTDIFAPDGVQPSWLSSRASKVVYAFVSRWVAAAICGASVILSFGLTPLNNRGFPAGLEFGLVLAAVTSLSAGGVHGASAAWALLSADRKPVTRRKHWLRVALLAGISGLSSAALMATWSKHPMAAVLAAEVAVLCAPLLSPHPEIGLARGDIRLIDRLRFSFRRALRAGVMGIGAGVVFALIVADDATAMLVVGFYLTSLWFLFGGLRGRQVSAGARPYECVVHSFQWGTALGLLSIPLTALPTAVMYGGTYGLYAGLTTAAVLWLWYGGMGLVQYAVLRVMLSLQGSRIFRMQYLEAASDRALLHRLGNGYIFVHPMLRAKLARRWGGGPSRT